MGLLDWLRGLFRPSPSRRDRFSPPPLPPAETGLTVEHLASRLAVTAEQLRSTPVSYSTFFVPKRSGGQRKILAPSPALKDVQRRILHRLLKRLRAHPAAKGFERGESIATHARLHARARVVLRLDIQDFFPSTRTEAVEHYFRRIGWNAEAAALLTRLCTHDGSLPQGAPTSPRLSNLLNYRLDARLSALAAAPLGGHNPKTLAPAGAAGGATVYSRYADDITFSFDTEGHGRVNATLRFAKSIVEDEGYRLHTKKKLRVMRRHDRQTVTGLVVNDGVRLPRKTRRWLRAVEHRLATGGEATLTAEQLHGWRALQSMIESQATPG